jgi:hypothetical protein
VAEVCLCGRNASVFFWEGVPANWQQLLLLCKKRVIVSSGNAEWPFTTVNAVW